MCDLCECQGTALKPCLQRWPCWGVTDLQCGWCIVLWYNSLDSSGVFQDFLLAERLSPICSYSSSPARKEKLGKSLGILPWVSACIYTRQLQRKRFFFSDHVKMVSPISFKFKMHLDLVRRIWQGAKVPGVTESWCDPKCCAAGQALLPSPVWWQRAPGIWCIPCMEGLRLNQMLSLELSERIGVGMLN